MNPAASVSKVCRGRLTIATKRLNFMQNDPPQVSPWTIKCVKGQLLPVSYITHHKSHCSAIQRASAGERLASGKTRVWAAGDGRAGASPYLFSPLPPFPAMILSSSGSCALLPASLGSSLHTLNTERVEQKKMSGWEGRVSCGGIGDLQDSSLLSEMANLFLNLV